MKQVIRMVDNINNKVTVNTVEIPNKMHLDAQIRFPHRVQRDRTKYTRKQKHKNQMGY